MHAIKSAFVMNFYTNLLNEINKSFSIITVFIQISSWMVNELTSYDECGKTKTIKANERSNIRVISNNRKLNADYMRKIKGCPIFIESGSVCLLVPDASTERKGEYF